MQNSKDGSVQAPHIRWLGLGTHIICRYIRKNFCVREHYSIFWENCNGHEHFQRFVSLTTVAYNLIQRDKNSGTIIISLEKYFLVLRVGICNQGYDDIKKATNITNVINSYLPQ